LRRGILKEGVERVREGDGKEGEERGKGTENEN